MDIVRSFTFDAAHYMPTKEDGHAYRRMHGHSFEVEVTLSGDPDPQMGWVEDLGEVGAALSEVREKLDHQLLNEVEGLGVPTLENLCLWVAGQLRPRFPALSCVCVRRPTIGESCTYKVI